MADHSSMKLGKRAPKLDARTLKLVRYTTALPPAPVAIDWSSQLVDLGPMLNDQIGDCTCAAIGHVIQTWTSMAQSQQVILPDSAILGTYEMACGYNPSDPSTDSGGVALDVLNWWRKNAVWSHKLDAYASISPGAARDVRDGIWLFGAVYVGLALPVSAQQQDIWDADYDLTGDHAPGSWGGHAVPCVAYDADGLTCITWGELKRMTWSFWRSYCDEAYALLSPDWIGTDSDAPSGFDMAALQSDLTALG